MLTCLELGRDAGVSQQGDNSAESKGCKLPAVLLEGAVDGLAGDLAPHRLVGGELCDHGSHKAHHGSTACKENEFKENEFNFKPCMLLAKAPQESSLNRPAAG